MASIGRINGVWVVDGSPRFFGITRSLEQAFEWLRDVLEIQYPPRRYNMPAPRDPVAEAVENELRVVTGILYFLMVCVILGFMAAGIYFWR